MNRVSLFVLLLLGLAFNAIAQPAFPAEELWRCDLDRSPTAWSSYWEEDDGGIACLVGLGNRFVMVSSGEIIWESPELNGDITALCRADFGLEDGQRALAAVVTDSTGEIWEFYGEGWEEAIHHIPENFHIEAYGFPFSTLIDYRVVNCMYSPPISIRDSSRSIILGNRIVEMIGRAEIGGPSFIHKGRLLKYSLGLDESLRTQSLGSISDFSLVDMCGDNETSLFLAGNRWRCNAFGYQYGTSKIFEYNFNIDEISSFYVSSGELIPYRGDSVCYFGIFPANEQFNPKVVCVGWIAVSEDSAMQRYYWSEYPLDGQYTVLDSIEYDDFRTERVVEHEDLNGNRCALLMEDDGRIRVLGVDEEAILGNLMFEQGVLQAEAVVSERGVRENMLTLFDDHVSLYGIGALSAPQLLIAPVSWTLLSCFPNPFNSTAMIEYSLASPGLCAVTVTDLLGREVARLSEGWQTPGRYRLVWGAEGVASGSYYVRVDSGGAVSVRQISLCR